MKDDSCSFCKLANGDIPTLTLYEDDDFRVIFDAAPATDGHALILPKDHYRNIYDIDEEVVAKAYRLAKKLAVIMTDVFGADGFNILQNSNECAGQTVFHFHIHLIPRYEGHAPIFGWNHGEQDPDKLNKAILAIQERLS